VAPDVQGRVFAARRLVAQFTLLPGLLLAGPLSDRVFEPLLAAGGPAAALLAPLVGAGPGAGIGLLTAATAVLAVAVAAAGWASRTVREVETTLPDRGAAG
jgi:hypothetical protein